MLYLVLGLQQLATTSPEESVRRAARGALWVIRISQPERPPSVQESKELYETVMNIIVIFLLFSYI